MGLFSLHDLRHPLRTWCRDKGIERSWRFCFLYFLLWSQSCFESQVCFVFREASTFWRQKLPSMAPDVDRFVFMLLSPKSSAFDSTNSLQLHDFAENFYPIAFWKRRAGSVQIVCNQCCSPNSLFIFIHLQHFYSFAVQALRSLCPVLARIGRLPVQTRLAPRRRLESLEKSEIEDVRCHAESKVPTSGRSLGLDLWLWLSTLGSACFPHVSLLLDLLCYGLYLWTSTQSSSWCFWSYASIWQILAEFRILAPQHWDKVGSWLLIKFAKSCCTWA